MQRFIRPLAALFLCSALAQAEPNDAELLKRIAALEARVAQLEARLAGQPVTAPQPAAARPNAAILGKYVKKDQPNSGDFIRLRADKSVVLATPNRTVEGTYRVDGNVLTLYVTVMGYRDPVEARIENGTIVAKGETWVRATEE